MESWEKQRGILWISSLSISFMEVKVSYLLFHFFTLLGHFRVSPGLCLKTRVGAQPLIRKSFFILMQIKLIFTRKVVYLASFSKWGFLELGSDLLATCMYNASFHEQNDSRPAQTGRLKPHNNCIGKYFLFQVVDYVYTSSQIHRKQKKDSFLRRGVTHACLFSRAY